VIKAENDWAASSGNASLISREQIYSNIISLYLYRVTLEALPAGRILRCDAVTWFCRLVVGINW